MSKNQQQAAVLMAAAVVGSVMLSRFAKQQAAVLGIPAFVVGVAGIAIGSALR
ncbi:hypothetical protein ACIP4S_13120 [Streptomyces chartreusis]|uniref:hypothetical protein n=1 Tax=Streptomyces chartreusis TaxID=1969 RepID=UPI003828B6B5